MQLSGAQVLLIVHRYADALLHYAEAHKGMDKIEKAAQKLFAALDDESDLVRLIRQLHYQPKDPAVLESVIKALKLQDALAGLLRILARNKRLLLLKAVLDQFLRRVAHARGEIWCDVKTAAPLAKDKLEDLSAHLEKSLKKTVKLSYTVDPSVLGGMVIAFDNHLLDLSAMQHIKLLKAQLLQTLQQQHS